jgi:hypothetical protein
MRAWTAAAGLAMACSQPVDEHPSPPSITEYDLRFPSTAVAVATESVQVMVFDASVPGADCLSLATARQSGVDLPASPVLLADTGAQPICTLTQGQGTLEVSYGLRSFFAVSQRQGQDFFFGCTQTDLEADNPPVDVWLAEAKVGTTVPVTTCLTLSQKCGGSGC